MGHVDQEVERKPNGLTPSMASQKCKFFGSLAKFGYVLSMCFHAAQSDGTLRVSSVEECVEISSSTRDTPGWPLCIYVTDLLAADAVGTPPMKDDSYLYVL